MWRARKDSTAAVAGPPPGSGDRQSVAPAMPPPPRPSVLAGRVGAVKNSPEAASAAGEVINEAGESRDDAWAPDESAWATYASSGDPPADEGPTAPVPVASLEVEPVMAAHPLAVPNAPSSGSAAHRQPPSTGQLASRVLAGAITGVLASGVVASIVLHPHGLAHFETVQVKAPTVTSLFPNQYTGASVAPDSPPLVIVPPGSLTTSRVPTAPVPSATTTAVPPNRRK